MQSPTQLQNQNKHSNALYMMREYARACECVHSVLIQSKPRNEEDKDLIAYLKRVPEENGFMVDGDYVRREAQIGSNCDEEESEELLLNIKTLSPEENQEIACQNFLIGQRDLQFGKTD
ncbi:unnamed protein product [Sphenostylis stenocarpa]|uniref:Uncharacterized protein n=1 Tax=Sphenostylis stenocarpa TaxID=92480 RepID=A0AA86S316_9FABA|nr:unnamed protein product [Sphenostylis stenocarpa]